MFVVRIPVQGLVDAGMEPVVEIYLDTAVDGILKIGVNREHYTGFFACTNLAGTRCWHVAVYGLRLMVQGTMPHAITASDTGLVVGFTTVKKSIVASLSLRITVLSSHQVTDNCSASYCVVHTVDSAARKLTEKDLVFASSSDLLFSGLTEIFVCFQYLVDHSKS